MTKGLYFLALVISVAFAIGAELKITRSHCLRTGLFQVSEKGGA